MVMKYTCSLAATSAMNRLTAARLASSASQGVCTYSGMGARLPPYVSCGHEGLQAGWGTRAGPAQQAAPAERAVQAEPRAAVAAASWPTDQPLPTSKLDMRML